MTLELNLCIYYTANVYAGGRYHSGFELPWQWSVPINPYSKGLKIAPLASRGYVFIIYLMINDILGIISCCCCSFCFVLFCLYEFSLHFTKTVYSYKWKEYSWSKHQGEKASRADYLAVLMNSQDFFSFLFLSIGIASSFKWIEILIKSPMLCENYKISSGDSTGE